MTDDPRKPEVRGLLERHLAFCLSETPPEHSFALNVDGLLNPKVTFVSYRDGDAVLGVAAIKELDAAHGESSQCTRRRRPGDAGWAGRCLATCSTPPGHAGTGACHWRPAPRRVRGGAGAVRVRGIHPAGPFADYPQTGDNCFYARIL